MPGAAAPGKYLSLFVLFFTLYCCVLPFVVNTDYQRDNARNNARSTQARKTAHGLDGQHQDVDMTPSGRVSQNDRGQR